MTCTETYKEHIMYSFNGFCKVVIRYAAINAWRERNGRRQKEISFEYLTEEKFYPLNTPDKHFAVHYEEYPVTICGQTIILTNEELVAALLSLPERERKLFTFFFRELHTARNGKNVQPSAEYHEPPLTQCLADAAGGNGGILAWGILNLYRMKRLSGQPAASRKPWTRF